MSNLLICHQWTKLFVGHKSTNIYLLVFNQLIFSSFYKTMTNSRSLKYLIMLITNIYSIRIRIIPDGDSTFTQSCPEGGRCLILPTLESSWQKIKNSMVFFSLFKILKKSIILFFHPSKIFLQDGPIFTSLVVVYETRVCTNK